MPNFKKYNYDQTAMAVINFEEQLQPGTFEFTLHKLIDNHIDLSVFYEKYTNDTGGRSAYDPDILLKIILYAYTKGSTSSREIQWHCEHNIIFKALSCDSAPHLQLSLASLVVIQMLSNPFSSKSCWYVINRVYWVTSYLRLMVATFHPTPQKNTL